MPVQGGWRGDAGAGMLAWGCWHREAGAGMLIQGYRCRAGEGQTVVKCGCGTIVQSRKQVGETQKRAARWYIWGPHVVACS